MGALTLPNRIVFGAHLTNFGQGNVFSGRHRAYYRARAEGGAGMIVTEALTVHPLDWPYEHVPFGHTDAIMPSLIELREAVRGGGTGSLLLAQLNHTGGQSNGKLLRQSPWAPSAVVEVASKRMAREMEPAHIEEVVAGFAAAAGRVAQCGLDGVELNAGQYALLRQFLSPLTNFRGDDYGGALENRLRFPLRVIRAVRNALGAERILGIKLSGDELAPWGGLTCDDAVAVARAMMAAGGLDYFSITIGGPYSVHMTEAAMPVPQGHAAHLAEAVRKGIAAAVPVLAEGRIESPHTAQAILAAGKAEAVVMTRALVSDPDLPRKVARDICEPLRPHIGMTRYFSVLGDWNRPLGDLINPRAGRESILPAPAPADVDRPALVIGGGPAGMEAALTLARQARTVVLREAGNQLGGMAAALAREVPARGEFANLVDYYMAMLERLGVQVELNRPVVGFEPDFAEFEAIYLAAGAQPPPPPFPVAAGTITTPRELLTGAPPLPGPRHRRAVVADYEYGFRMASAVEWLLERDFGVDVITEDFFVGRELVESAEFLWFERVTRRGARFHPRLQASAFRDGALICRDRFSGRERVFGPASLLVVAQPERPLPALLETLREAHPRVLTVGDARAPRLMGEAILNAHRTVLLE